MTMKKSPIFLTPQEMSDLGKSLTTDFGLMRSIASDLIDQAIDKDAAYGASWKARGGQGAYFTYVRKPDRLEAQLKKVGYNFFDISIPAEAGESIDETLRDNVNYCLLVLTTREMMRRALRARSENAAGEAVPEDSDASDGSQPTSAYVDQDRQNRG
jgi:hypothetical protein